MRIYLSGGMRGFPWQDKVMQACPDNTYYDPRKHGLTDPTEYTQWDMDHIAMSDLMFAYLSKDNPSGVGLAAEVGYAAALNKPIIFVNETNNKYFLIVECLANTVAGTLNDGIQVLRLWENLDKMDSRFQHGEGQ